MFALFFSLYYSMFVGQWVYTANGIYSPIMGKVINKIGVCLTSMFNNVDSPVGDLGDILFGTTPYSQHTYGNFYVLIAYILATITSIGIVVMAVKGVKKAFGIFFMGIR